MGVKKAMIVLMVVLAIACVYQLYPLNLKYYPEYYAHRNEPSFTFYGRHDECTGCLDVYRDSGIIVVPADLVKFFGDTLTGNDIILAGHYPDQVVYGFLNGNGYNCRFTGKLVAFMRDESSEYKNGIAPVFYVEKCTKVGTIPALPGLH